ncbi:MAG: Gfo/Idh/MocA family oxidoreductase [Deltaproteobacteria bacterium]|nr:Gfo/Idh/MocA family oxidoreductase [Deltaproteobacteria bacterium]
MSNATDESQSEVGTRVLKIGILGIGVSGARIARAMAAMPEIRLVAGAARRPELHADFAERYGARIYGSAEEICRDPEVQALWISTPNQFHAEHMILAASNGKHVIVEKPIAITMREAEQMMEAAERSGVAVVCGHLLSNTPRAQMVRRIIRSGELGRLCALNVWAYTDWMLRPRTAAEMDFAKGGGVPYRQAPHQVDTLRLLGGGLVRSVRGMIGQWLPERTMPGYYSAYLEFEDGTPATLVHNGYGYFMTSELVPWAKPNPQASINKRTQIRHSIRTGNWDEGEAKTEQSREIGRENQTPQRRPAGDIWVGDDLGIVVATCERGDIRYSARGVYVYDDQGIKEVPVERRPRAGAPEIRELYDAVVLGKPVTYGLSWGAATLEVCLGIIQSAQERREITLQHQVPVPDFQEEGKN